MAALIYLYLLLSRKMMMMMAKKSEKTTKQATSMIIIGKARVEILSFRFNRFIGRKRKIVK